MPLLVENYLIDLENVSLDEVLAVPSLAEESKKLHDLESRTFDLQREPVLYVKQHEYAIVSSKDGTLEWIVSDAATTCLIATFRHKPSGLSCLTHMDGESLNLLQVMIAEMMTTINQDSEDLEAEQDFEVKLLGGYRDEHGFSDKTITSLIRQMIASTHRFTLLAACVAKINSKLVETQAIGEVKQSRHTPHHLGAALNLTTGVVIPAKVARSPNGTLPWVPLNSIRALYMIMPSTDDHVGHPYLSIYEPTEQCLFVPPIRIQSSSYDRDEIEWLERASQLPDAIILKYCSTSPHDEPEHFASEYRSNYAFLLQHLQTMYSTIPPGPNLTELLFPDNKPRRFRIECLPNDSTRFHWIDVTKDDESKQQ